MSPDSNARAIAFAALGSRPFDLLVIGGGITGCGIARDAALRGLRVALVEKDDFASGTSSRSSRLIHGGVRYLEHGHLHLVFESSAERRRLLRLSPHLVQPLRFTWPVYTGARIPRWKLGAGLALYDALALFGNVGRHRRLSRRGVLEEEPRLREEGLVGGAMYYDAATNDARLTLANAMGAIEAGAIVLNHAVATDVLLDKGRAAGAAVRDSLTGKTVEVRATVVVSAKGPWTGAVRGSKGAHIAVARDRLGNRHALTLISSSDGRVLFALPAGSHAIIGTTDGYTSALPDDVHASNDDVRYLLESANAFFPDARLGTADVVAAWAGIRPLLPAVGINPGAVTREHAITTDTHGVIAITGGKLTTYRVMARDTLRAVYKVLGTADDADPTGHVPLPGGNFSSLSDLVADIARTTHDVALAEHLATSYGSNWPLVWREIQQPNGGLTVHDGLPYTLGELRYSLQHEMAATLGDLLIRRTHVAFETRDHGAAAAERIAADVGARLGWDIEARRAALTAYQREVERMFSIGD